jgi:hypothetical protein
MMTFSPTPMHRKLRGGSPQIMKEQVRKAA